MDYIKSVYSHLTACSENLVMRHFKKKKSANIRQTPCSAGVAGPAHLGHFFVGEVDL